MREWSGISFVCLRIKEIGVGKQQSRNAAVIAKNLEVLIIVTAMLCQNYSSSWPLSRHCLLVTIIKLETALDSSHDSYHCLSFISEAQDSYNITLVYIDEA
ncbi:hypothetical protein ES319_D09G160000v1 [Gossypium barbadense]|uniref:Uncharacterized protein n=2 Tax=Gossypium TaxID=3633 RepID=A0A5J5Q4B6_GOSBA|nr:hypothetical protein ES319_D09G160000v1 [Gossypium barbadense]TYG54274.1 hypothetical protein ES288_D09G175900v1 [Gossypium darwinii]